VGFDVANERTNPGIGLSSMRERVSLIQGQMSVTSEIGQGTTIEVRAPLKETTT
jgi:signal transduction histidine kinase